MWGPPDNAKVAFDNSPYAKMVYWSFILEDGSSGIQSRVFLWNGAMAVALDEKTHEVYVVQQTRESPEGPVSTLELPGGGIDNNSFPLDTARQELLEEAGVVAIDESEWIQLYSDNGTHPIDGLCFTDQHAFLLLRGKRKQDLIDRGIKKVFTIPITELLEMDHDNKFRDPLTPYALYRSYGWLMRNRPDLIT